MEYPEKMPCEHETSDVCGEERLTVRCERCDDDFDPIDCLPGILLAMEGKYEIGSIVISDYRAVRLSAEQVDILVQMREIIEEIESFSTRATNGEDCDGCEIFPSRVYSDLRKKFISDPGILFEELPKLKDTLEGSDRCSHCEDDIDQEMNILAEKALDLRASVMTEGFSVKG